MSRRLFCGSQAPPSSTPELLPAPVQLAKETRLTVKPNREDDSKPRRRERGGDDEGPVNGVAPPRFTIIFLPRGGPREREREGEERGLVKPPSLSTPFRSVPPFLDRVCTHHLFPRRIPIPPSGGGGGGGARGRPLTARRAVYLAV